MLQVKTKIGQSSVHGIGLFADQFIPKGTVTWNYEPAFDSSFSEEEVQQMNEFARDHFLWYSYFDFKRSRYVLPSDGLRFINHSKKNANIFSTPDQDIAARDIEPGEELLCDYDLFDPEYWDRHNIIPID